VTIFLVILAILLLGGTALLASGRPLPAVLRAGARAGHEDQDGTDAMPARNGMGLVEPVAALPLVLLPDAPGAHDVDAVRFGLGLRGYRMDQVDEVLDRLAAAIEERDAVIRTLRSQLAERGDAGR
jgi:DivIVA domain-containing protein